MTKEGRFFGCEVKTEKGVLSDHQTKFIQAINESGGIGFVARSVDDVIKHLDLKRGMLF
jgi:hypothetical protein